MDGAVSPPHTVPDTPQPGRVGEVSGGADREFGSKENITDIPASWLLGARVAAEKANYSFKVTFL